MIHIWNNIKNIVTYSDSEFLELLIAFLHFMLLPIAVLVEIGFRPEIQILAVLGGLMQLYSVGTKNLSFRYASCYLAVLISVLTVETYYTENLLEGSRYGWLMIAIATMINLYRVGRQWTHKRYS